MGSVVKKSDQWAASPLQRMANQRVAWEEVHRFHPNQFKTTFYLPAIVECCLCFRRISHCKTNGVKFTMHKGGTAVSCIWSKKKKGNENGMIQQFLFLLPRSLVCLSLDVYESVKSRSAKRVRLFCRKIVKKGIEIIIIWLFVCVVSADDGLREDGCYAPFNGKDKSGLSKVFAP